MDLAGREVLTQEEADTLDGSMGKAPELPKGLQKKTLNTPTRGPIEQTGYELFL